MNSSFLIAKPRTYAYWWTCVPVLPLKRNDHRYLVLKRQWADHTMNCLSNETGSQMLASSRGFYVQHYEDHITTVLFDIWAGFPDTDWVAPLLDLWNIPHGTVRRVGWSYSWEQKRSRADRPDIPDIVLSWEDELGQAVLIIEAKRPNGKLSKKDLNGGRRYLEMPSIRPFTRKAVAFLVDERDTSKIAVALPLGTPVTSWQAMGRLQAKCAGRLPLAITVRNHIRAGIAKHYSDLGLPFDTALTASLGDEVFSGTSHRYEAIRALGEPDPIERLLLGFEVSFCARTGQMPSPPMPWLAEEPSFVDVANAKGTIQTTTERERPLWRLSSR